MLALLAGQYVFGRYPSFALILARPIGMVAVATFLIGFLLMAFGAVTLIRKRTTIHPGRTPQKLVTRGLFALTRNPIYLGMLVILTTIPLMATQPRLLIFTLAFFLIMNFYVIPREERIIRAAFGAEFDDYCQRTRRWLGTRSDVTCC
ncbi:MAG: hypothetical protein H6R05_1082 [Burkholderiaceae bacterium]|nr:hypothetical protein [Burkholderiaceae bacterium]